MKTQRQLVRQIMRDGVWRRPEEIAERTGLPMTAGLTARIRELRNPEHGGHTVKSRPRPGVGGSYEYQVIWKKRG